MPRSALFTLLLGACVAAPGPSAAPDVALQSGLEAIDAQTIAAHVGFLSHDLLEGRAPGTRGGRLAEEYIASQFAAMGLEAPGGSYFQRVPILAVTADPAAVTLRFAASGGTLAPTYLEDFVAWSATQTPLATAEGELVFVGYGVNAPEYGWNDYAGVDMAGKVALVLVNDPPATAQEPDLFGARAMTYYGRWTYKLEEAERQGAAGVILIHTTESASYGWSVVQGGWSGPQYQLPLAAGRRPLPLQAWITYGAAGEVARLAGREIDRLVDAAQRRGFTAVPLGVRVASSIRSEVERTETANVVGLLRGTGDEVVVYSAHYDHMGIGPVVDGDSIYNGALDNASGVGVILEVADAFAALPVRPARSVLFVALAAEESGLLGAQFYVQNPLFPLERTAANLNIDMTHFLGRTRDVEQLGGDRSTLGADLDAVLAPLGMRATGDPNPEQGSFFRSDHFHFAKAGVPALYFKSGVEVEGRPEGWGLQRIQEFDERHYHQPSDEVRPDFDWATGVQLAEVAFRLGHRVATAAEAPRWLEGSEFQRR